jgi:rhodanese-related sulfurtransferase
MQSISRDEARTMMQNRSDLTIVEALSEDEFREFHLPGAKNAPLDDGFEETIQQIAPEKSKPVLVYCHDAECQASPKAARKMEELGYQEVYDYEAGKMDWKAAGLPVEGDSN